MTSPTLLAFHLAAQVHPARAERAFDYLQSRHLTTAERLQNLVDDIGGKGRNGTRVAREMAKAPRAVSNAASNGSPDKAE